MDKLERLRELLAKATEPRPAPVPEQDSRVGEAGAARQDDFNYRLWRERTEAARAEIVTLLPDILKAADEITRLNAEVERLTNLANPTKLHAAIEHGDEEHRAWLREALVAYFDGRPIPADRGGSRKQALIDEMVEGLEGASTTLNILARVAEDVRMEGAPMIAERAAIIDALILKARGKDANVG